MTDSRHGADAPLDGKDSAPPPLPDPPPEWRRRDNGFCGRCDLPIPEKWRHHQPPCRRCAVRSVFAVAVLALVGMDARPWLYRVPNPDCPDCDGSGWSRCQPQDLSILRVSGACRACGAWAFELTGEDGRIAGSGRHYDDLADHEVEIGPAPLVRSLDETLDRHPRPDEEEVADALR